MRLTTNELALARDAEDWSTLWTAAIPWVKFVISSMGRQGLISWPHARRARKELRKEVLQEGSLAAGGAIRNWDPDIAAFSTYICLRVRGDLINYLNEQKAQGLGTRWLAETDQDVELVTIHADPEEDEDGEEIAPYEPTYADTGHVPEDLADPETELERQAQPAGLRGLLARLAPEDAANLRDFYGISISTDAEQAPSEPTSIRDWAARKGLSRMTAHRLVAAAERKLGQKQNSRDIPDTGNAVKGPQGRESYRWHIPAHWQHPFFFGGFLEIIQHGSAWLLKATGMVWNDWSWKPPVKPTRVWKIDKRGTASEGQVTTHEDWQSVVKAINRKVASDPRLETYDDWDDAINDERERREHAMRAAIQI
jgi:RNA polymerase sigma factor (sigma-70 family)